MTTIGIICGSLRKASYNKVIANVVPNLLADSITYEFISIADLPLFNEDLEAFGDPEPATIFKSAIERVDGLLIVTPEYNAGIPGGLKNAIDWASRPAKGSVLEAKPIGIIGATPGGMGTAFSQMHLRQSLEQIQANVLPFKKMLISQVHTKVNIESGELTDEKTLSYLTQYVDSFIKWTEDAISNN